MALSVELQYRVEHQRAHLKLSNYEMVANDI
jgi:hypothetical protein